MRNSALLTTIAATLAITLLTSGCQENSNTQPTSATPQPTTTAASAQSATTETPPASTPSTSEAPKKNLTVMLDPGHNGGNANNPAEINRQVPAGRGATKPCNTTGTATSAGYPEHAFNFDVARKVGDILTKSGIQVGYTRESDDGVGPCVNKRADMGNAAEAAAVVSIHADGAAAENARGFHIAYSAPPLNAAQGLPAMNLSRALRDSMREEGFPLSTYIGQSGLSPRNDLAGLNLSTRPAALVECGNMRNPTEAKEMSTPEGRQRYANAIASGIQQYLGVPGG